MKRILFVLKAVNSGGSATSMLNLLGFLKEKGYKIDLFLLQKDGCFLERAESVANVLPEEKIISSIMYSREKMKGRGISSWLIRVIFVLCHKIFGVERTLEWFYRISARSLSDKYDTVVAYQESQTTEYVQYIRCKRKIAWIHSDYHRFSVGKTTVQEQSIYDCFDEIVCVSQIAKNEMLKSLDLPKEHVHLIYNTIPREFIVKQSQKNFEPLERGEYTFLSMGRFVKDKGFDRAVRVARRMKKAGVDFRWYIIGAGEEAKKIEQQIADSDLTNNLILLGLKSNPFSYVKQADCFVMTSRNEAQPMVLNEALTLGIPVISTRFPSVLEVVADGIDGFVVENSENGIYQGIVRFMTDDNARKRIEEGAKQFRYNNDDIVDSVIKLL